MTWDGTSSPVDHYFTIAELRAFDRTAGLESTAKYSEGTLEEVRDLVEEVFERNARVAFVPRTATETLSAADQKAINHRDGVTRYRLVVENVAMRSVTSITIDGVALTAEELAEVTVQEWGGLERVTSWGTGLRNIVVVYEHGMDAPPAAVKRAAMLLAVDRSVPSGIPSRATGQATGDTYMRFTLAGKDGPTGLPDVDAVLAQFGRHRFTVG